MSDVAIVAFGAVSALGEGREAASAGEPGAAARVAIARDETLAAAGLAKPYCARVRGASATELLARALASCARELDAARPGWRAERVGYVVGTSSGGMREATRFFDGEEVDAEAATYFGPFVAAPRALDLPPLSPAAMVLGACASSTIAIGVASRWLETGSCDVALAGGVDDVSVFVAAGFEVLRATSARVPPAPFRVGRDGMALGEGAAILALARAARARAYVRGFGASSDVVHLTAPDRSGAGLARAAAAAIEEAAIDPARVDLVSAHATATPFNDAAEARAIERTLGTAPLVHPFKAQIGHTLGAAGALEILACVDAMERGVRPAAAGEGELDPACAVPLLATAEKGEVRAALKLSAAFGGANAALVVARDRAETPRARPARDAFVSRARHVARAPDLEVLASRIGAAPDRLARVDRLTLLALAAIADLRDDVGPLDGAGVIVGHALATLETNALFQARIRERGARAAEPRRFPYTSPNAVAGECTLAFGLSGPSFAVGGGLHGALEALAVAALLVEAGDAARLVVVAADEVADAARTLASRPPFACAVVEGAVALLVSRDRGGAVARVAGSELRLARGAARDLSPTYGHAALLPLVATRPPRTLEAATPPDAIARIQLATFE